MPVCRQWNYCERMLVAWRCVLCFLLFLCTVNEQYALVHFRIILGIYILHPSCKECVLAFSSTVQSSLYILKIHTDLHSKSSVYSLSALSNKSFWLFQICSFFEVKMKCHLQVILLCKLVYLAVLGFYPPGTDLMAKSGRCKPEWRHMIGWEKLNRYEGFITAD